MRLGGTDARGYALLDDRGGAAVEFRILGGLEVDSPAGPARIAGGRRRALLIRLLVAHGQSVSADRLIDDIWDRAPPAAAASTLQSHVSLLRRALGPGRLITRSDGYALAVDDVTVDAWQFEAELAGAREALAAGDPVDAAELLTSGLGRWRGPALADVAGASWAVGESVRLEELHLDAMELLLEARLACGDHGTVVAQAEAAIAEHPLREGLWAKLMLALYRSGRQADALRAYQRLRTVLGEELGIEPSTELAALEEAIVLQKPELDWTPDDKPNRWPAATAQPPGGLPSGTVTFLFTDIEGSTAGWESSPDEMSPAVERHDQIVRSAIERHHGHVFATGGDGFAAAFARATDALSAALEAQAVIGQQPWSEATGPLRVRMGLHSGEAQERGGDYFGRPVNQAARIMAAAHGGQILCSGLTAELAGSALVELGEYRLRGVRQPVRVFQVGEGSFGPLRLPGASLGRPPSALGPIVGRQAELAAIDRLLQDHRLVTVVGVGGVGKTRLAVAVAEAAVGTFGDGVVWVDLAPLREQADVAQAVGVTLGIAAQPGVPMVGLISDALSGWRRLLVLDNCEHVRTGVADLVASIGASCPEVVVLATSRERLGVEGERLMTVSPLPADGAEAPAVELLVDRIGGLAADPEPRVTEALCRIAQHLDGLPLALELAAPRCRTLGAVEVASRLGDLFGLLADRSLRLERHRTLEATLRWSYELLSDDERMILEVLSVFSGSLSLPGAERLAAAVDLGPEDAHTIMSSLVDKSLVGRDGDRFRLLETTRQFAAQRLADGGRRVPAEAAHSRWVLERVRAIHPGLRGPDEAYWVAVLDAEWPDVSAVVRRGLDDDDADTITEILAYLTVEICTRRTEGFRWITEALHRWPDYRGPHSHELLGAGTYVAFLSQDPAAAVDLAERALAADPSPGTAIDLIPQHAALGAYFFAGQVPRGMQVGQQILALTRDDPRQQAKLRASGIYALLNVGKVAAAVAEVQRLDQLIPLLSPSDAAYVLTAQAAALRVVGDPTAPARLDRARAAAASVRNLWSLARLGGIVPTVDPLGHHDEESLDRCLEATDELARAGWLVFAWTAASSLPPLLWALGRTDEAALALGACEASGVPPQPMETPPEFASWATGTDPQIAQLKTSGAKLTLPRLLQVIEGEAPLPA